MIEWRSGIYLLLGVILIASVSILSYQMGVTSTLITTTTETSYSTLFQTTTVSTTITEVRIQTTTSTYTTTISKTVLPFQTFNLNTSTAGILLFNGRLLLAVQINGSAFHLGETVNITATLTNLTPQDIWFMLNEFQLSIYNSNKSDVWTAPEGLWRDPGFRPPFGTDYIRLKPFETYRIPAASSHWNLTELQRSGERVAYTGRLVPEGQYKIIWHPSIGIAAIDSVSVNYSEGPTLTLELTVKK